MDIQQIRQALKDITHTPMFPLCDPREEYRPWMGELQDETMLCIEQDIEIQLSKGLMI